MATVIAESPSASSKNPKPKATLSLNSLLKPPAAKQEVQASETVPAVVNHPVLPENLHAAWDEFAEGRKNQMAEYQIMKREYRYSHPIILITLTNPVEETLLDNFRRDLIQYLRETLKNADINIAVEMKESAGKKVLYTSKEKFEHLAEKNPYLNELKERLGLDWDF
jgi:DNA polymerase-3 subunit gamma/tau